MEYLCEIIHIRLPDERYECQETRIRFIYAGIYLILNAPMKKMITDSSNIQNICRPKRNTHSHVWDANRASQLADARGHYINNRITFDVIVHAWKKTEKHTIFIRYMTTTQTSSEWPHLQLGFIWSNGWKIKIVLWLIISLRIYLTTITERKHVSFPV